MKVFVGYGYNARDIWIENQILPILNTIGFSVVHGKDMHGKVLHEEVKTRIEQCDAVIGFFTIRAGQGTADFTSHIWVRDEMLHANALHMPIIPIKEQGVKVPDALLGDRQFIMLDQSDRLGCVSELIVALGKRNMRRVKLDPEDEALSHALFRLKRDPSFAIRYRTQDESGIESEYRMGRLELVNSGFYLNVIDIPNKSYLEIDGLLNGAVQFSSGWTSTDAIQVKIY